MWPLPLSSIINNYAGYIQTQAQIDRDEAIEAKARQAFQQVKLHIDEMRIIWAQYVHSGARSAADNEWERITQRRQVLESMDAVDSDIEDDDEMMREAYNQFIAENRAISPEVMTGERSYFIPYIAEYRAHQARLRAAEGDMLSTQFAALTGQPRFPYAEDKLLPLLPAALRSIVFDFVNSPKLNYKHVINSLNQIFDCRFNKVCVEPGESPLDYISFLWRKHSDKQFSRHWGVLSYYEFKDEGKKPKMVNMFKRHHCPSWFNLY